MMRAFVAAVLVAGLAAGPVRAEQESRKYNGTRTRELSSGAAKGGDADTSALVQAARKAKTTKKKSRISITDESVKKSTGKLIVLAPSPEPEQDTTDAAPSPAIVAARAKADAKLASAKVEVEQMETELRRIEEAYYLESDPKYRDDVLRPRFEQTRKQLDRARDQLLSAREERQSLDPAPAAPAAETPPTEPPADGTNP
ncbi:MAG: hypothetical protein ACYC7A_10720 [Thermoanaerobaculia bacterium]